MPERNPDEAGVTGRPLAGIDRKSRPGLIWFVVVLLPWSSRGPSLADWLALDVGIYRRRVALIADWLPVAVAASLPWSTSLTAFLIVLWLIYLIPTLKLAELRRIATTAAGGLPVAFVVLALVGMTWADVPAGRGSKDWSRFSSC